MSSGEDETSSGAENQGILKLILKQNKQKAEQNARLMAMMERFNNQEAPARPSSSPEFIIESLASNIGEFCYDPENGNVFDRWFQKYKDLFIKDGSKLDDAAKVRLLLRSLSVTVHDKYVNFVLPTHPRDFSFEDTVKKLKQLFGMRTTLFSKRYQCFQISKRTEEDYVTYAAAVNKRCEDFELNRITADQFKSLIFICGLRSPKVADVRTRLLAKLESEGEGECKLETLINECQRVQNLKHDTALVEQKSSINASVCAIKQKKQVSNPTVPQSKDNKLSSGPKTPCWQCGGMHYVRECPFANHTCKSCNKIGHKEGYCNCNSVKPNVGGTKNKKKKSTVNGVFAVNQTDMGKPRITEAATDQAKTASGKPLHLIGELGCPITLGKIIKNGTCYVTTHPNLNLFGLDWIELFELWSHPLSAICNHVRSISIQPPIEQYKAAFPNVFKETLGLCKKTRVKLFLKQDARPVFKPKRPVPFTSVVKVDAEIDRLERLGIITPVNFSQWAAPIVTVKKPNGKVRICADYSTGLNAALEPNNYPLPVPDDIFTKLNGCKFFSIIDLSDAYLQVEVDDESKQLLTINTHRGLYRFNRLAPGVKSAPGAFQQLMNGMIADLDGVESFLDDIFVYSRTELEHHRRLTAPFKRLEEYGFHLREEKCSILQRQIKYLGHIVDANGLRPDPAKVEAISKMPAPTDVTSLRSFLGAVNFYSKFVRQMHQLRHPLDALLKKDVRFHWSSTCQLSFEKIKQMLQSDLLLTHYDPNLDIIIAADASKTGIGAVALHRFPDGSMKAIAHASRSLTQAEVGYSQVEKEGLALVFGVTKFHRMILGRKFTLQADNQPLMRIFGSKKGIPPHTANRLQRWALTLLCYDFEIEYISTTQFGYADVLSHLIDSHTKSDEDFIIATIQLEEDVEVSLNEALVIQYNQKGWPSSASSIEDDSVRQFYPYRESVAVVKGYLMMSDRFHCNHGRNQPWERIHIDFAGPFFDQYFLVVVDAHSKWPEVKIVQSPTTPAVTEFLDELFSRFGDPETVVSDNGSQFTSDHFAAFCKEHEIQHLRTAPYHPQSNGQAERFVDTLKRSLMKINEGEMIAKTLQGFLQTYRSTPSRTLQGKSPTELMLGRKMRTILSLLKPTQQNMAQFPVRFKLETKSMPRYTANKWIWSAGEVIEAIGNVNYNVLLEVQHKRRKLIRSHANQLKHREADGNPPDSTSELDILVDMFGLHPVPTSTIHETTAPPPVLPDVQKDPVEAPVETPILQDISELPAGHENEPDDCHEQQVEAENPEQPVTPVLPTSECSSEIQNRPQRLIRMPSRFEPYLVFWK
ncbi:uncharacterized protein K02A2.6-like [Wyeomyia smithii]|uniref:uncharacterized protein K02A2.6-like n=1 Tax=Wyeomyia smithii TaxID=174621 RepID=UPI0024681C8B|nr:uncharacterized protein K02A2.6-like [Wyeomyia smithii]